MVAKGCPVASGLLPHGAAIQDWLAVYSVHRESKIAFWQFDLLASATTCHRNRVKIWIVGSRQGKLNVVRNLRRDCVSCKRENAPENHRRSGHSDESSQPRSGSKVGA